MNIKVSTLVTLGLGVAVLTLDLHGNTILNFRGCVYISASHWIKNHISLFQCHIEGTDNRMETLTEQFFL